MDKAIASTLAADPDQMRGAAGGRDERVSGGWERFETDEKRVISFFLSSFLNVCILIRNVFNAKNRAN